MTKLEILEVFGVTLNELFEKMPALECVEVNSNTKRTMGTLHPSYEINLYFEGQRNIAPDCGNVIKRSDLQGSASDA